MNILDLISEWFIWFHGEKGFEWRKVAVFFLFFGILSMIYFIWKGDWDSVWLTIIVMFFIYILTPRPDEYGEERFNPFQLIFMTLIFGGLFLSIVMTML